MPVPAPGTYRTWVRTRDWVGPWKTPGTPEAMKASGAPGAFQILIDGTPLTFDQDEAKRIFEEKRAQLEAGGAIAVTVDRGGRKIVMAFTLADFSGARGR